jgi:hypothetical protein
MRHGLTKGAAQAAILVGSILGTVVAGAAGGFIETDLVANKSPLTDSNGIVHNAANVDVNLVNRRGVTREGAVPEDWGYVGRVHDVPTLLDKVVEAIRSAGATEEIIAAAVGAAGTFGDVPPRQRGRRRQYANEAARRRAWQRRNEIHNEIPAPDAPRNEIHNEIQPPADPRHEIRDETPNGYLWARLDGAARGRADLGPIASVSANVSYEGGPIAGTWSEASHNVSGNITAAPMQAAAKCRRVYRVWA